MHRVVLAGLVKAVAPQAPESRAALENAERHALTRRRTSLESGHGHERCALATLQGFAYGGSRFHTVRIERNPPVASTTGTPLGAGPDVTETSTGPARDQRSSWQTLPSPPTMGRRLPW